MGFRYDYEEPGKRKKAQDMFPISFLEVTILVLPAILVAASLMTSQDEIQFRIGTFMTTIILAGISIMAFTGVSMQQRTQDFASDFAAIYIGFFLGIGALFAALLLLPTFSTQEGLSDAIQLFCVAVSEELFFRLAIPRIWYSGLRFGTTMARWFTGVMIASISFGVFHGVVYGYETTAIIVAIMAGFMQAVAYYFAAKKSKMFAFTGIVLGHWFYDLWVVGAPVIIPAIIIVVIFGMIFFAIGANLKAPIDGIKEAI